MSKIEQLEKRIAELEAEVVRLKAFPPQVIHSHYHYNYGQPSYLQPIPWGPAYPNITYGGPHLGYASGT